GDSTFQFSDLDHQNNGGEKYVTVLAIAASWCPGCFQETPSLANLEDTFAGNDRVRFVYTLYDPGQPYSCTQWGNLYTYGDPDKKPFIITETEGYNIADWFYNEDLGMVSYPQHVVFTPDMQVHYKDPDLPAAAMINALLDDEGLWGDGPISGCTDAEALNYNSDATLDDGSCTYDAVLGCMDIEASNYNPSATLSDDLCIYVKPDFDDASKILSACVYNPTDEEVSSADLIFCLPNENEIGQCLGGKVLVQGESCTLMNGSGEYSGTHYEAYIGDLNHEEGVVLKGTLKFYTEAGGVDPFMVEEHYIVHLPTISPGDMNSDGNINVVDVVLLVNLALAN
ncbi:MAG: hypothetical protein QGI45_15560, partial [Myxococcota bacterium]|nr:hypothetical protein [Myxococcota bacterium]